MIPVAYSTKYLEITRVVSFPRRFQSDSHTTLSICSTIQTLLTCGAVFIQTMAVVVEPFLF